MSENAEIIIDVDVDTKKVDKRIEKLLDEISSKKIELDLQLKDMSSLRRQLKELDDKIKEIGEEAPTSLISSFNDVNSKLKQSIQNVMILKEEIKSLSSEYRKSLKEPKISGLLPAKATKMSVDVVPNFYGFFKRIDNIKDELSKKINQKSSLEDTLVRVQDRINKLGQTPELINAFNGISDKINQTSNEINKLNDQLKIAKNRTDGFEDAFKKIESSSKNILPENVNTRFYELFKNINKLEKELSDKLSIKSNLENDLKRINEQIRKLGETPELVNSFNEVSNKINLTSNEINELSNQLKIAKGESAGLKNSFDNLNNSNINTFTKATTNSFKNFNSHAINSSKHVDYFGKRIFNLLRNAFVFNVISRQFRGLSTLLGNLINRDVHFAKSLMIVKANLVRAFAPIWQIILPWIRALGEGLVWISNQLIKFINYLTGSKIKPLEGFKEAKQVVDDFNRIASPTKDLFDLKDPNKYAKELRDNIKRSQQPSTKVSKNANRLASNLRDSQKQTTKLLASFDKLEVLKLEKIKDPLGLNELSDPKNLENNKDIDINVDVPSIEEQIADAINNIEVKPLDFYVNDDIGEQIKSQVNSLTLPPLDFKVSEESQESVDNFKKKLISLWETIEPLTIAIAKFFTELVKSFGRLFNDETTNKNLKDIVKHTADFLNNLSENKDTMDKFRDFIIALGVALATYKIAKTIVDITKAFRDLFALFAWAFDLSNPVGWVALAIGCLYLIIKHWGGIEEACKMAWEKIKEFGEYIKYIFPILWDNAKEKATELFDKIKNAASSAWNWLKEHFIDPIGNAFGKIGSWFGSKFGWHSGSYSDRDIYNVPRLAQGSVLKGGDPFLAYLNDQPRGQTNIEAPLSTIVDAFKQALSESDYNRQPDININASGDMSGFIRMLNFKLQDNREVLGNAFIENIDF